jgi:hypothetical protein
VFHLVIYLCGAQTDPGVLRRIFDEYDRTHSGFVSLRVLQMCIPTEVLEYVRPRDLEAMFVEKGIDPKAPISFESYCAVFESLVL